MRVVVDTNVLISALLSPTSLPAELLALWRSGRFTLLMSAEQFDELTRVTRYPKLRERLHPALAGRLINELRDLCENVDPLPRLAVSRDPHDDYLLAMASAGKAHSLITGDKRDLLALGRHDGTAIVTVAEFLSTIKRRK